MLLEFPKLGQACRERDWITRERSSLVDRSIRREVVHDVGPASKRSNRESPPQ